MRLRRTLALVAALALAASVIGSWAPDTHAQGCAMCKTALTNSPEGRAMARSFNTAILLMLAAPYLVFGAGAAVFFRRRLRAGAARAWARLHPSRSVPQLAP